MSQYSIARFKEGATYISVGNAIRWKSNNNCLMADTLKDLFDAGLINELQVEGTNKAREIELDEFFATYQSPEPTEEDLFEMRATFGEGAKVTNVITGRVIQL